MKKLVFVVILSVTFLLSSIGASALTLTNLMPDPSFENGIGVGTSGPWAPLGSGVEISTSSLDALTGTKSILATAPGWGGPAIDVTDLLLDNGGGNYTFTCNVKAADSNAVIYFFLYMTDGDLANDDRWLGGSMADNNVFTDRWISISSMIEIPDDIVSAMMVVVNYSGSTRNFYVDDISITKEGLYDTEESSSASSSAAPTSAPQSNAASTTSESDTTPQTGDSGNMLGITFAALSLVTILSVIIHNKRNRKIRLQ